VWWLARWSRDALPPGFDEEIRAIRRTVRFLGDQPGWRRIARRSAEGEGRKPTDVPVRPSRSRRPGVHEVIRTATERRCPACQMTRAASMFVEDAALCRDCA
jgi:hypothetical protein